MVKNDYREQAIMRIINLDFFLDSLHNPRQEVGDACVNSRQTNPGTANPARNDSSQNEGSVRVSDDQRATAISLQNDKDTLVIQLV